MQNAFGAGWWWGFGYFIAGFWWLGAAFLAEPQISSGLMPLGVFGLPAAWRSLPALGFALARLVWAPGPAAFSLAAALALANGCAAVC